MLCLFCFELSLHVRVLIQSLSRTADVRSPSSILHSNGCGLGLSSVVVVGLPQASTSSGVVKLEVDVGAVVLGRRRP